MTKTMGRSLVCTSRQIRCNWKQGRGGISSQITLKQRLGAEERLPKTLSKEERMRIVCSSDLRFIIPPSGPRFVSLEVQGLSYRGKCCGRLYYSKTSVVNDLVSSKV